MGSSKSTYRDYLLRYWIHVATAISAIFVMVPEARGQNYPFDAITLQMIQSTPLFPSSINGSNDASNQIPNGSILLYKTDQGRYGKLMIQIYGYNLTILWVTYNSNGSVFSQGSNLVIRGTYLCDLDLGLETSTGADFWWNQLTAVVRYLEPRNGALFAKFACSYSVGTSGYLGSGGTWIPNQNVLALPGCTWSVTGVPSWITINSGASGNGNGTINFTIAPNPGTIYEYANLRVGNASAGATFYVAQNGQGCTYALNPPNATFPPSGGTGSFSVNTPGGCYWTQFPTSFVTITGITGVAAPFGTGVNLGNGSVSYSVDANGGAIDRNSSIGYPFTFNIRQMGLSQSLTVAKTGTGTGRVTSAPAGIDCGGICLFSFPYGQTVTLSAQADLTSVFSGWSGEGCSGIGTCTVTMTQARNITATFSLPGSQILAVTKAGSGTGTVTSAPAGITCGTTCQNSFPYNQQVTLSAQADPNSVFAGWTGEGCSGTGSCIITMSQARFVTATFMPFEPTLTVTKIGTGTGTVTSVPAGINCGSTCSFKFPYNQLVELIALPDASSVLAAWQGEGCSGTGACYVTMTQARNVTATFMFINPTLTVTKSGGGTGTVTSTPAGINCGSTCSFTFPYNQQVVLAAQAASASIFTGWSGEGCSGTGTCTVIMTQARNVTATFTTFNPTLVVTKTGTGTGTVTSSPAGISCGSTCSFAFPYNQVVTLTGQADSTSVFTGWSAEGCSGSGTCVVTMTQARNVTATFTLLSIRISGYVRTSAGSGIAEVVMNGLPGSPSTDAAGFYSGTVNGGWSGTVAPSKTCYSFTPPSTSYSNVSASQTTNYTGTQGSILISGYVLTSAGVPISGVVLQGLTGNPSTDSNGFYSASVGCGWSGTATPTKTGYKFEPASTTYTGINAGQTTNYTGTLTIKLTEDFALGLQSGGGGWIEIRGTEKTGFSSKEWAQVSWPSYASSVGESHPAYGDIDGDGQKELVVGLGSGAGGWLEVLKKSSDGWKESAWIRINDIAYNSTNGLAYPAIGDVDGDGKNEIVAGLGSGSGGWIEVFGDASTNYIEKGWIRLEYPTYNAANGSTIPVIGDIDGDGKNEIVVGLGKGGNGYLAVISYADSGYSHKAWLQVPWNEYNAKNGSTFPAIGDVDGDGKNELIIGLGEGGDGWLEVVDNGQSGYKHRQWLQISWAGYRAIGEAHPACIDVNDDGIKELVIGLGKGGGGWLEILNNSTKGFKTLQWIQLNWAAYNSSNGATTPAP